MLTFETYSAPKGRFLTREYRNWCLLWWISTMLMEQAEFSDMLVILFVCFLFMHYLTTS